ncbi:MAG: endo-1,4-beta-xylanase [Acidobacteria bacterium]|nr:endo-1,4-beta-xylanase [Acidobacteriota bacterium]
MLSGFGLIFVALVASGQQLTLKDAYGGCFLVGAAVNSAQFTGRDSQETAIIQAQFNTISPENVLKWESLHPRPGTYDFTLADKYVEFGRENHMFIIGHNLIWHSQVPKWVFEDNKGKPLTRKALLKRMREHIQTVVGRYRGKIQGWDVVNEVVDEDGTLRRSGWLKIIGPDYIEKAFQYAHKADPKAQLYYNDYNLENEPKRQGALALVAKLKAKGVHITGVGLQDHVNLDSPKGEQIESTIEEFGRLGMKVMITELDVGVLPWPTRQQTADVSLKVASDSNLNPYPDGLPEQLEQRLAARYTELFRAYRNHCGLVTRVTFWGVSDKDSWKNNWPVRGRTDYPLLFDRRGQPKPAFDAVIQAAAKKPS